jgi:general secretion pathway protein K
MNHCRGVALITVLLVVSFATVAAVALSSRLQVDIRRTENLLRSDQAWQHALGIEKWAQGLLMTDLKESPQTDNLLELWYEPLVSVPIEGGMVNARLYDQQGLFNLNNLLDAKGKPSPVDKDRFQRLLAMFDLERELANAVIDWLDENTDETPPRGAEDSVYQGQTPAYRSANRRMAHVSELLLVEGFTSEAYEALEPYVTALPDYVRININTAPVPVLMSLAPGIEEQDAEALVDRREQLPYTNENEFLDEPALAGPAQAVLTKAGGLGVKSDYFLVKGAVDVGKARVGLSSLLRRTVPTKPVQVIHRMREGVF